MSTQSFQAPFASLLYGMGGFSAEYQNLAFVAAPGGPVKEKARQCRAFSQILK
jgi:hypothetical protein